MKRAILIFATVILFLGAWMPLSASAETYLPADTDLKIQVDDSEWYVFTRDNLENNPELEELNLEYDFMYRTLHDNDAYMDAMLLYNNGDFIELIVRKKAIDSEFVNLSNYDDDEVLDLAEQLAERQGAEDYSVYKNQYKFAKLEYKDPELNYHICEYVTLVNKENYTFTFQASSEYTDAEYEKIQSIVDSIRFYIDPSLKEPNPKSAGKEIFSGAVRGAIIGGISGGVAGAILAVVKKKKKRKEADTQSSDDLPQ